LHVLKRWAVLPRGTRWTTGVLAAVVITLIIVWALFVPAADWLAHHDVGSVTGSLHETAVDNARGRLLTLGAGLFAAGALAYTARNFTLSRQGQVTDRYSKAIDQLGSGQIDVRIGGIYALERIARDSARDHPTVMDVLTAFIRDHSNPPPPSDEPASLLQERTALADIQAALTVVGRRDPHRDIQQIRLAGANLTGAYLVNAKLAGADLRGAHLVGAYLPGAYLDAALLNDAHLEGATLTAATLTGAHLESAHLTVAHLDGAHLEHADLTSADLTGADLTGAHLEGAHLAGAAWPGNVPVPKGWTLDPGSGHLKPASAGSAPPKVN
jgi:uncharacterized protein YjbI with pentapeptide repeats